MTKKKSASVEEFKKFVKKHPSLISEVRKGKTTWQEVFEEWYLLGEESSKWKSYEDEVAVSTEQKKSNGQDESADNKTDFLSSILGSLKNMDINQIQQHVSSLNQALGAISGVISQFQSNETTDTKQVEQSKTPHPFSFRKD
ncbi:YlbD family protein [Peribacillus alkalitolerans]|uniref:YlbD family protein n=1 Tax=Peribacillus alkalitolerans TaxID=1550385 RepID=UPI0013D0285F|nr:YlbD family protein [Peribacillus alkalitolerans]